MRSVWHIDFDSGGFRPQNCNSTQKLIVTFCRYAQTWSHHLASHEPAAQKNSPHLENLFKTPFELPKIYPFFQNRVINRIANKWLKLNAFTFQSLVNILNAHQPDIIHVHNRQDLVDKLVSRLSYQPKTVVHYHRNFETPVFPKSANLLLTVSQHTKNYLISKGAPANRLQIIPNAIPATLVDAVEHGEFDKLPVESHTVKPVLMYAGGKPRWKGIDLLLEANQHIQSSHQLWICGPQSNTIPLQMPSQQCLGKLSEHEFYQRVSNAAYLVMPSIAESFGLAALEALYLKTPVIASEGTGLTEFIDDTCGFVVQHNNSASLQEGIQKALDMFSSQPERYARFQEAAFKKASLFHPAKVTAQLEELYNSL